MVPPDTQTRQGRRREVPDTTVSLVSTHIVGPPRPFEHRYGPLVTLAEEQSDVGHGYNPPVLPPDDGPVHDEGDVLLSQHKYVRRDTGLRGQKDGHRLREVSRGGVKLRRSGGSFGLTCTDTSRRGLFMN